MRRRGFTLSVVLAALLLAMTVPAASAGATRTDFVGFVFPAGYLDGGASCVAAGGKPGNGLLPTCVLEEGTTRSLGGGRTLIRNELVMDISYAWHSLADIRDYPLAPNEPRRTGYVLEYFNANLDPSLSGPVWGSWEFYSFGDELWFDGELMFTGHFSGRLDEGQFTTRGNGIGVGDFENQHVWLDVVPEYVNMSGQFLDPGSH
jgi:hypothetical protein